MITQIIKERLRKRLESKGIYTAKKEIGEIRWDYLTNYLEEKQQKVSL